MGAQQQDPLQEPPNNQKNGDDAPSETTAQLYYYQNPTTGSVSNTPLLLPQLVKLLVPVREGMTSILPPHTQCLAVRPSSFSTVNEEEEEEDDSEKQQQQQQQFGEWKPVSSVNVLKEAACSQWFLTGGQFGKDPKGPLTCRSILDAYAKEEDKSKLLAFAQDITSAWTPVEKLPLLQQVLQALQPAPALPVPAPAETDTPVTAAAATPQNPQQVQDELEAFLLSTAAATAGGNNETAGDSEDDDDHAYESDGGTRYVKDPFSDRWIHEALAPPKVESKETSTAKPSASKADSASNNNKKNPNKKAKFSKRNARHWVYVTGLPANKEEIPMTELQKFFGKVGLLDLDPETMQPKIKLYRDASGKLKGDASLCYARPESVELALQVLDESPWDEHHTIRVTRAKFEAKSDDTATSTTGKRQRRPVSEAQRKVARLALIQAQDEGFGVRLAGGRKGLRIVVVKHMLDGIPEADWETRIQAYCQELDAAVEKITCISKTKVVIIKFAEPTAAAQAVEAWNGKVVNIGSSSQTMEALYWDGVTDYTHQEHNPEEEEKRHEDFGKWLDNQGEDDLPPDLRLQVAEE